MGIFSGAGAYGSACILLDKVEYVAGDVVSGRVRLSVATRIDRAEPIRMTIEGCETLAYDEEETRRVVVQPREGDENHHSHEQQVKHVNHEKLKYTMLSDAIILDVPARSYEPGMYEFPFEYQLPVGGLVPTFAFKSSYFGSHLSNVRACAEYELKVRVPLVGMFKVDIRCSCTFVIRDEPSLQAPCRVTESKTLPVYYLFFWQRGTCSLTATLEQNVVPVGGAARVEVLVNNDSTRCVDSVTTALSQIVKLNHTKSSRDWSGAPSVTRKIASNSSSGIEPGENMNAVLTQVIEYDKKGCAPLMPTMRSHFLSFQYELNVKCRQAWCWEDPSVTFPIVLTTKSV